MKVNFIVPSTEFIGQNKFIGIGTDLIDIRRIEKVIQQYKNQFLNKIFTSNEIKLIEKRNFDCNFIAKRWAGKEATIKAMSGKISWKDVEITNHTSGKPQATLKKYENIQAHISLTDEYPYAQATVFLFSA